MAIAVIVLLGILGLILMNPPLAGRVALGVFGTLAVIIIIATVIRMLYERRAAARQAGIARELARAEAKRLQEVLRQEANQIISATQSQCQEINREAWAADAALDRAQAEFAERAFAPYWDAVEVCVNCLARIDTAVQEIDAARARFTDVASKLETPPPAFTVSFSDLPDVMGIAERMHSVVRLAQKDFEFATIFEQRKTNRLLVSGFGTLAWAVAEMGVRLQKSISRLGR